MFLVPSILIPWDIIFFCVLLPFSFEIHVFFVKKKPLSSFWVRVFKRSKKNQQQKRHLLHFPPFVAPRSSHDLWVPGKTDLNHPLLLYPRLRRMKFLGWIPGAIKNTPGKPNPHHYCSTVLMMVVFKEFYFFRLIFRLIPLSKIPGFLGGMFYNTEFGKLRKTSACRWLSWTNISKEFSKKNREFNTWIFQTCV